MVVCIILETSVIRQRLMLAHAGRTLTGAPDEQSGTAILFPREQRARADARNLAPTTGSNAMIAISPAGSGKASCHAVLHRHIGE